ncbi:MAG: hypothetical protein U9N33_08285 [Campylobacterota bacterium]|nr:hypothetical protein [Campylobacterota bacterium]
MLKIFLGLVLLYSLASSSPKATGCDLSQIGDVAFSVGAKSVQKADYKAIAKSGKNFRSILVGSTIGIDGVVAEIVDIEADKRVRGKPRTGTITVSLDTDTKQRVKMNYTYSDSSFSAKGVDRNGVKISLNLKIAALLCHAN